MDKPKFYLRLETGDFRKSGYEAAFPAIRVVESFFPQPDLIETADLSTRNINGYQDAQVKVNLGRDKGYTVLKNEKYGFDFAIINSTRFYSSTFVIEIDLEFCAGKEDQLIALFKNLLKEYPTESAYMTIQSVSERLDFEKYYRELSLPPRFGRFYWYQFIPSTLAEKLDGAKCFEQNRFIDSVEKNEQGYLVRIGKSITDSGNDSGVQQRVSATRDLALVKSAGALPDVIYKTIVDALKSPQPVIRIEIENYHGVTDHPMPKGIRELKKLRYFSVNCSLESFTEIPDEIGELTELEELHLFQTSVTRISPRIGQLKKLRVLSLQCKVKELPEELTQLENLEVLVLREVEMTALPDWISRLKNLKVLDLDFCRKMERLPETIGELLNLEKIILDNTAIKTVPESFSQLHKLEKLSMRFCRDVKTDELFDRLKYLAALADLDLYSCGINELPPTIGSMKALSYLDIASNSLKSVPPEIVGMSSWKMIRVSDYSKDLKKMLRALLPGGKLVTKWNHGGTRDSYTSEYSGCQRYIKKDAQLVWHGREIKDAW